MHPSGTSGNRPWKRKRDPSPPKRTAYKKPRTSKMVDKPLSDLKDSLLSVLECPVCMEIMKSPIIQCSSGHSFCSSCIKQVTHCPVCNTSVNYPVRNFHLEEESEQVAYPCPNKQHGCQEIVYGKDDTHKNRCPFREYICPLSQDMFTECTWKGLRKHIREHVEKIHVHSYLYELEINELRSFWYRFEMEYEHDVELFFLKDHLFVSYDHYEKRQGKCWKAIQYLGPRENASKFMYQITFVTLDEARKITYTRNVHTEDEDVYTLFETDSCFTITEKDIQFFKEPNGHYLYNMWNIIQVK